MKITANLSNRLETALHQQVITHRYPSESAYGLGLAIWDLYSRQPHTLTGPLLRGPRWTIPGFVTDLLEELGDPMAKTKDLMPYRMTVRVPLVLAPFIQLRVKEERYRSASAYMTGLVLYDLKKRPPDPKRIPHYKTAALLSEPEWLQVAVFKRLAEDFGEPLRTWPKGINGRIDEIVIQQRQLPLK